MKTVKGNLVEMGLNGDFDVIVHGCNCFHTMGAGIAKEIRTKIPEAYAADLRTLIGYKPKLGTYSHCRSKGVVVVNAYTQYDYKGSDNVDYTAIKQVFKKIAINGKNLRIGIPMIGCGLAGGDWEIVKRIIDNETSDIDITLVEFDGGK